MDIRIAMFFLFLLFSVGFVVAQESMTVETDIYVPEDVISIEVPDYIYVGNLTWGFDDETEKVNLHINNTGTVDIKVTPELADPNEDIFSYLYFARLSEEKFIRIGDGWSLNISAPSKFGGKRKGTFYMKLDLSDYGGDFDEDYNQQAQVNFIAVKQ